MKPWYDQAFGSHYPLLYQHRNEAEAQTCLDLLDGLFPLPKGDKILDLGCGEGRHLRSLAKTGFDLIGMDLSWPLLKMAAESAIDPDDIHQGQFALVRGDMQQLPFAQDSFRAVLSLFTAFGYFGDLEDNAPVVQEVSRVLKDAGVWYLDYVDCHSVVEELGQHKQAPRIRELGPLLSTEKRRLTDGHRRVEKEVELLPRPGMEPEAARWGVTEMGVRYTESVALFDALELVQLAGQFGLELIAQAGSYQGAALGSGNRWIFVFQKNRSQ